MSNSLVKRDLRKLSSIYFTKVFCERCDFSIKVIDGSLIFFNNYIVLHVYGYLAERVLYFDFYSSDFEHYISVDGLLNRVGIEDQPIIDLTRYFEETNLQNITEVSYPVKFKDTLSAEQDYFTYITAIEKYLSDFISSKFVDLKSYFKDATRAQTDNMNNIIGRGDDG